MQDVRLSHLSENPLHSKYQQFDSLNSISIVFISFTYASILINWSQNVWMFNFKSELVKDNTELLIIGFIIRAELLKFG